MVWERRGNEECWSGEGAPERKRVKELESQGSAQEIQVVVIKLSRREVAKKGEKKEKKVEKEVSEMCLR